MLGEALPIALNPWVWQALAAQPHTARGRRYGKTVTRMRA